MSKGKIELFSRPCRFCGKTMQTTSRKQVVHPECRIEYYKQAAKERYIKRNPSGLRDLTMRRNRSRYRIKEEPCAACKYILITKEKKFIVEEKEHIVNLCPRCLVEVRCGFLTPLTWERNEDTAK